MTMIYILRCNTCMKQNMHGTPHLSVGLRPGFSGSTRDMHFCSAECLERYIGNLHGTFEEHQRRHAEMLASRATK